jgi:catechol 2,3-dioxygenase
MPAHVSPRCEARSRPDENGVELYYDRPRDEWPLDADGRPTMFTQPVDLEALLAEAS